MKITSEENILQVLGAYNPWWRTNVVPSDFNKPYRRFAFYEAMIPLEHADIRRTVILSGARRVGKTIILYQMIQALLEKGVESSRICFVSLDHPLLKLCNMYELIATYRNNIYSGNDCYFFFDEIQYASDWDHWLKVIYDTMPKTRCAATGSASPILSKKTQESGVGRWTSVRVPTLSFYEYCNLLSIEGLPEIPRSFKPTALRDLDEMEQARLFRDLAPLQQHFNRYMLVGGFPELALSHDESKAKQVMREDIVDKVLKRDIPALFNIRNSTDLERIFLYLCYNSSNIVVLEAIAKELQSISAKTVGEYISYLESAHLIYKSLPVDLHGKKILRPRSKIYIADAAIRNAVLMRDDILTDPAELGIVAETTIYEHVAEFYYQDATQVGYYRDTNTQKEIDVVVEYVGGKILIEVKYRANTDLGENEAIVTEAQNAARSLVITKNADDYGVKRLKNGSELAKIPGSAFCYLLGHTETHR